MAAARRLMQQRRCHRCCRLAPVAAHHLPVVAASAAVRWRCRLPEAVPLPRYVTARPPAATKADNSRKADGYATSTSTRHTRASSHQQICMGRRAVRLSIGHAVLVHEPFCRITVTCVRGLASSQLSDDAGTHTTSNEHFNGASSDAAKCVASRSTSSFAAGQYCLPASRHCLPRRQKGSPLAITLAPDNRSILCNLFVHVASSNDHRMCVSTIW